VDPDDLEAQFTRSLRRRRAIITVVLVAVVAGPFGYLWWRRHEVVVADEAREAAWAERARVEEAYRNRPLSNDEAQALRQLAPATRQAVLDMRDAWQRGTTQDALDAVTPSGARCPERFSAPTIEAGKSYETYGSIDGNYFGSMHFRVVRTGEPIPEPEFARRLAEVDAISARIAGGKLLRPDLEALSQLGRGEDELFVLVDQRTEPVVSLGGYVAGQIVGTAYLYSQAQQRVICAGDIDAKNAPEVEISYTYHRDAPLDQQAKEREAATTTLARNLDIALRRAIATSMRATE
jgi:hypothetical protein